jgi:hypothetical protein
MQPRTKLFISYSHRDRDWLERLQVHLQPLVRSSTLDVWDDTRIQAGSGWNNEIVRALAEAKIAVLLVSADFLASDYVAQHELPRLLEAARAEGTLILPVIVSASRYLRMPELAQFQAVNDPKRPLNSLAASEQEAVFEKVAARVEEAMGQQELRARVDEQQRQLAVQQGMINDLVTYLVSSPIFRHLCGLAVLREYKFWDGSMTRELYFLRDIGFIKPRHGDFVAFDARLNGANLSDILEPTPIGWSCIRLRKGEVPPEWVQDEARRDNLRQDVVAELGL